MAHYRHTHTNYEGLLAEGKVWLNFGAMLQARVVLHERIKAEWYFQGWGRT